MQINTSGEASKYGLQPDEAAAFLRQMPAYSGLRVRGFMTLALFSAEAERVRQCFVLLRTLRDRLRQDAPAGVGLDELSMGMSGDYEIAIEEGATVVRVGQPSSARATRRIPITGRPGTAPRRLPEKDALSRGRQDLRISASLDVAQARG